MPEVRDFVLVVSEGCPGCDLAKRQLKEMGKKGRNIRVVDVQKDEEATDLVRTLKIRSVPTFVMVEKEGNKQKACLIDVRGKIKKCAKVERKES